MSLRWASERRVTLRMGALYRSGRGAARIIARPGPGRVYLLCAAPFPARIASARVPPRRNAGMSHGATSVRVSVPDLAARKGGEPIVCLTAYTTPVARLLDPH